MDRLLKEDAGALRPGHAHQLAIARMRLEVPVTIASPI
jgi:hypothetical protein